MKQAKYIGIILVIIAAVLACVKKEAPLTPSNTNEYGYILPQGNNSYDQRIMDYYNRFGTFVLYKFNDRDAYYSILNWDSTYRLAPADPAYVDKQLDLLDTTFFRYYPDAFLKQFLPRKFLLCSSVRTSSSLTAAQQDCYYAGVAPSGSTSGPILETFIANWGNERILKIKNGTTVDSVARFRSNINYGFLRMLNLQNKTGVSEQFVAETDYTTALPSTTQSARYKRGFLSTVANTNPVPVSTDWVWFVQAIVQNPYTFLTSTTGINANTATMQGILTPVKDSSGLIRKKYDAIIDYYKSNYNIDLQKIGNGAK